MNHHWKLYPFAFRPEEYVIVESSAGALILCEHTYIRAYDEEKEFNIGESRPVLRKDLEMWAG
jgi:hypothetical protein